MEIELPDDFKEFLRLLRFHGVRYLVVGGWAVIYHGYPRATGDLDVWVAVSPDKAERVIAVLREFGVETPRLSPALFLENDRIVRMGVPPLRIEILTGISGVTFDDCYDGRVDGDLGGAEVSLISLRDLKANKLASGRTKDLADVEELS
jgi:hypothetical protein